MEVLVFIIVCCLIVLVMIKYDFKEQKRLIEILAIVIIVLTATVGPFVTYWLNSYKEEKAKKNHEIGVLRKFSLAEGQYLYFLSQIDGARRAEGDATAFGVFIKMGKGHPYPYFGDIKDPEFINLSDLTTKVMGTLDNRSRYILDGLPGGSYAASVVMIQLYVQCSQAQVEAEIQHILNGDDDALKATVDSINNAVSFIPHPI